MLAQSMLSVDGGLFDFLGRRDNPAIIAMLAIVTGSVIAMVGISVSCVTRMVAVRSRQATVREVASYVAAGDLSPEDAAAMLKAAGSSGESRCGCGVKPSGKA